MSGKFKNVPLDEGTNILFQQEAKFAEYDILYQKWVWEGISAESIIFESEDLLNLSDTEIEAKVRRSPLLKSDSQITIKRLDTGFTFVNFNFES